MANFFEFTENGIEFKGFQDVRNQLKSDWLATFGDQLDLSPTSPDGHHIDLEAKTINSVLEAVQTLATMFNRNQAQGIFLDLLAAFLNIHRKADETDEQLRVRMTNAETGGLATYDGMLTYLRDKIGADIGLSTNEEPYVVEEIPPHSFRVTVPKSNTATNEAIGEAIWHCKPAGIKSIGNIQVFVKDSAGKQHEIYFSRPVDIEISVKIAITRYTEETFPDDGQEQICKQIRGWATGTNGWSKAAFRPGVDVIPEWFYTPILTVPGIMKAIINIRRENDSWTDKPIEISAEQLATIGNIEFES